MINELTIYNRAVNIVNLLDRAYAEDTLSASKVSQITPVCLADYNARNTPKYRMGEMKEPQKAGRVAEWYLNNRIPALLKHYGYQDTVRNRLIAYNAGVGALKRKNLPSETVAYINKYNKGA